VRAPAPEDHARSASALPSFALRASEGTRASADRPIASPAVRARSWELGVDLRQVPPTGPGGRITREDLEAYAARKAAPAPAARPAESPIARPATSASGTREVRIIGLRRMIAQKMQESKRRIPHYTYVEEVDVTELEALRSQLNHKWAAVRGHLTMLPFLVRAIVRALREYPQINGRFDDQAGVMTEYDAVHVGIATQTDSGLMVPVLREAQARDLWACAAEIARLARVSRDGTAVRDELTGSTITITSLGKLGGIVSTPVINHPEVAIIGVNRIALRPMIVNGAVAVRQMMNLSSSFDHRVVDGAQAAGFVQDVRGLLEGPATLFID
jgi:2-oxoisovalerate dehydrogenase E2 component (dihydrolipoyl transacylase)